MRALNSSPFQAAITAYPFCVLYGCVWPLYFAWFACSIVNRKNSWLTDSYDFHLHLRRQEINKIHWQIAWIEQTSLHKQEKATLTNQIQTFIVRCASACMHVCKWICVCVGGKLTQDLDCVWYVMRRWTHAPCSCVKYDIWFERMSSREDGKSEILCIRVA